MKARWKFWKPEDGEDEQGNLYFRVGAWQIVAIEWIKIIIFIIAITIIGTLINMK